MSLHNMITFGVLLLVGVSVGFPQLRPKERSGSYFGTYGEVGRIGPAGRMAQGFSQFGQGGDGGLGFDIPVYSYVDGLGSLGGGNGQGSDYPGYGYGLGYFGGLPSYGSRYG